MAPSHEDQRGLLTARYDREARAYRELWAPILRVAALRIIGELARVETRRIIDVGTGVGALLPDLRQAFPAALLVGVDCSPGMLALAPAGTPRAVMDATQLAMPPASVDLVLMAFMLFHLAEPVDGLREARRVLRRGGRVGAVTWGTDLESPASRVWAECLDAHGAAPVDPATAARHDLVDTPEKIETLLGAAGFTTVRCWSDELRAAIEIEHLIGLRTSMGSSKPRFDSLAPDAKEACVSAARLRLESLTPEAFVARGRIVYAIASA